MFAYIQQNSFFSFNRKLTITFRKGYPISYQQISVCCQQAANYGHPLPVNLLVSKIVNALPEAFIQFRVRWRETPAADKTIDNLTVRLIAEEQILKSYHTPVTQQNNNLAFNAEGYFGSIVSAKTTV